MHGIATLHYDLLNALFQAIISINLKENFTVANILGKNIL
jgi:hypothetical protein